MDFFEAVAARRTIRDFLPVPISDETVNRIIAAGLKAPTNDHMRDWHFVVITDKAVMQKVIDHIPKKITTDQINDILRDWNLNDACQQDAYKDAIPKQYRMFIEASCMIVPLLKQKTDILHPGNLSDLNGFASIWCCIENIFLAATAEGYAATLRIPLGDEAQWARSVLGFPADYFMPCFIGVGKPAENAACVKQIDIPLEERIHRDNW